MSISIKKICRHAFAVAILFHSLAVLTDAQAGEGTFGWVTSLDLQPKGELELEERLQLNQNQASGTYQLWQSRTELSYGLTNDIQISGYLNASKVTAKGNYTTCATYEKQQGEPPTSCPYTAGYLVNNGGSSNAPYSNTQYDGVSLEAIWRITNPVTHPVGVGIYIEPTFGPVKDEIEARLILQSNFLDDKLIVAANFVAATEKQKWITNEPFLESMWDILAGVTYRFAPKWSGGLELRQHNDYASASWNSAKQTQTAWFLGPNLHYADKNWWATLAYRRQLNASNCYSWVNEGAIEGGEMECSNRYAWDSHTTNEFLLKFGIPF